MGSYLLAALLVTFLTASVYKILVQTRRRKAQPHLQTADEKQNVTFQSLPVDPLLEFDWKTTVPLQFRPFKPTYHITMALQATTPSDLIVIDRNYHDRILNRRAVIGSHRNTVLGTTAQGVDVIEEAYTYLMHSYLPTRYPTIFSLRDGGTMLFNAVTGQSFPTSAPADTEAALASIGETIEDDLFFLKQTPDGHLCVAFLCCHPSGFDPSSKLGKLLRDVHTPVPSYEKIGASMERFFGRIEVGKPVKRLNWNVTTQDVLFLPAGNHIREGDEVQEDQEVDIDTARVRVELQTLTRLPQSQALMFSFKTYMYPLTDIKDEGMGPDLADAIEGMKKGNAPGMWIYKGGVRWGKGVCEYLRT